ncbi:MAG: 6-phosphogluconolactonase [Rhodocyclaceae bacterium]|nr:6-phosphogluconolactonase [Rhodocyclaceae bacterium]
MAAAQIAAPRRVYDCADAPALAQQAARHVAALLAQAIARRGRASLAVSGGRSPVPLFEALSAEPVAWERVTVTLVDERWVAPDTADSNEGLVRRHLLTGRAAAASFVGLKTADATPAAAIAERSAALAPLLPFDVSILGMGEDGHTASLFPGAEGLAAALDPQGGALLCAIVPPHAAHARLGLTLRGIRASRQVVLCVGGAAKLAVLARAAAGAMEYPLAAVLAQTDLAVDIFRAP